jgi:hypothetical protein
VRLRPWPLLFSRQQNIPNNRALNKNHEKHSKTRKILIKIKSQHSNQI